MKINMHILREDLAQYAPEAVLVSDRLERKLEFPVLYSGEFFLRNDRVYLTTAGILPTQIAAENRPCIICLGDPPPFYKNGDCNIIWMPEGTVPLNTLLTIVVERFAYYQRWVDSLQCCCYSLENLNELGKRSEPIFDNPINLVDSDYSWLFYSTNTARFPLPADYSGREYKKHIQAAIVETLNAEEGKRPDVLRTCQTPYLRQGIFGYHSLCTNVMLGNRYLATLYIDDIAHPFTDRDYALLPVLGKIVGDVMMWRGRTNSYVSQEMTEVLTKAFRNETLEVSELTFVLRKLEWRKTDGYCCIKAFARDKSRTPALLHIIGEELCATVPSCIYALVDDALVFVVNISVGEGLFEQKVEIIIELLRRHGLCCGVSQPLHDFFMLPSLYRMSSAALSIGRKKEENLPAYFFDEYILDYVFRRSTMEFPPEVLCPYQLACIVDEDQRNGTDFVRILTEYLDNNMSIADTARKLFMHRNTLLYRLDRLKERLDMNLDDPDVRLLLTMSLRFMKLSGADAGIIGSTVASEAHRGNA